MHAFQWVALVVDILVILMLIGVTFAGGDAWPFSAYPMFSTYRKGVPYQRFFGVRFHFVDGRSREMPARLEDLLRAFQNEFNQAWPNAASHPESTNAVVARLRKRAVERDPSLDDARQIEVRLTVVQLGARGGLSSAVKSLGLFEVSSARG